MTYKLLTFNIEGLVKLSIYDSPLPETGALFYKGALTSNLSSLKVNANNKPVSTTTPVVTASVNGKLA